MHGQQNRVALIRSVALPLSAIVGALFLTGCVTKAAFVGEFPSYPDVAPSTVEREIFALQYVREGLPSFTVDQPDVQRRDALD